VDAQDFRGKWYIATVVAVKDDRILVNFQGWSDKWNTWYDTPRWLCFPPPPRFQFHDVMLVG
jgi:hypothetical protein